MKCPRCDNGIIERFTADGDPELTDCPDCGGTGEDVDETFEAVMDAVRIYAGTVRHKATAAARANARRQIVQAVRAVESRAYVNGYRKAWGTPTTPVHPYPTEKAS